MALKDIGKGKTKMVVAELRKSIFSFKEHCEELKIEYPDYMNGFLDCINFIEDKIDGDILDNVEVEKLIDGYYTGRSKQLIRCGLSPFEENTYLDGVEICVKKFKNEYFEVIDD